MPEVSVIIPTYNRAHLVGRAIQSVLDQTYQDFEIIVVDDGSTDNTEEIIKNFKDPRIRYIRHEQNRGGAAARNTGVKAARGEYIALEDSDDEWMPEKLEKQMKVFENAPVKVGIVYTGYWEKEGRRKTYMPSSRIRQKEGNIHGNLLKTYFVNTSTVVLKRECLEEAGMFDERLPRLQEVELFIRISRFYEFKCIDEPLVIKHLMPDSMSANYDTMIKAIELLLEKHYEEYNKDKRLLASYQYFSGNLLCQNGKMNQGRDYLFRAVNSYPLNIKYLVAAFVSLFGKRAYDKVVRLKRKIRPVDGSYKKDS